MTNTNILSVRLASKQARDLSHEIHGAIENHTELDYEYLYFMLDELQSQVSKTRSYVAKHEEQHSE